MPWFRIKVAHGPGHQSHSEKYIFSSEEKPDKETKREWFDDFVSEYGGMDYPIGTVLKVKLPEKERLEKISSNIARKASAEKMLAILGAPPTPSLKPVELDGTSKNDKIDLKKEYLIRYSGNLYAGRFQTVWFGLVFHPGWGASSMQLDHIEAVWELNTETLPVHKVKKVRGAV